MKIWKGYFRELLNTDIRNNQTMEEIRNCIWNEDDEEENYSMNLQELTDAN